MPARKWIVPVVRACCINKLNYRCLLLQYSVVAELLSANAVFLFKCVDYAIIGIQNKFARVKKWLFFANYDKPNQFPGKVVYFAARLANSTNINRLKRHGKSKESAYQAGHSCQEGFEK